MYQWSCRGKERGRSDLASIALEIVEVRSHRSFVDLSRMFEMCRRDQWAVDDLDWTHRPRPMGRDDEITIVQYFTDMAGIERLAAALFREQERRVTDPVLKE